MSNLIFKRLHWQDTTSLQTTLLPNNIQSWLLEQGSLTTKLKQYCREFEIKVQSEKRIKKIYQNE
ncbi:MAG TPA: chorismate lyase, partial [Pasteurellaceae bacterium]|nr:chorismate lyase [Pasteurellaceae bacterium]